MNKEILQQCWDIYKALGDSAFPLNHYDLSKTTEVTDPEIWKAFLTTPEVSEWIKTEMELLQNSELNKLLANVSRSRSVGQAQLINALSKIKDGVGAKGDGPAIIYMYVPLNEQEEHAPNVKKLESDPFLK